MSSERLQLNLLAAFERGTLPDVTIVAQGREVRAHKVVLAAQSEFFCRHFATPAGNQHPAVVELRHRHKVVQALVRFLYFAGLSAFKDLDPTDCLELLLLAEELGVGALDSADITPAIVPPKNAARGLESVPSKMTPQNAVQMLQHEGLRKHPALQAGICEYVGDNLLTLLRSMPDRLHGIPAEYLPAVLKAACHHIQAPDEARAVIDFCLAHTQLESVCDLLRDTKQWNWGGADSSVLRAPPGEEAGEGFEWTVRNVKHALEATPARIVVGEFFDWSVRLDYGVEGRLRLVYESTASQGGGRCMNQFPAATFAWRVVFRGQNVFNEKPVFICFPEGVQLHWSTTLPVTVADLADDDELRIMANMAENPMLSLILYYFSCDLKRIMETEDILNRLPHIEYRCLSSYSLMKSHNSA